MALLSGEVETLYWVLSEPITVEFRMALLSGEVETRGGAAGGAAAFACSGWLCYPGKLKPDGWVIGLAEILRSGWLCYPGKLKPNWREHACGRYSCSGWLCYPGKLKRIAIIMCHRKKRVPDGFAIRGS